MDLFFALVPLASVFVSLSFGGKTTPFVLAFVLVLLLLIRHISPRPILALLLLPSSVLRLASLFVLSKGALGAFGALALVAVCAVVSGITAYRGETAFRLATPLLFLALLLSVYVTAVSLFSEPRVLFGEPSADELISAFVCPISLCAALAVTSDISALKRLKAAVAGVALCAVFIIFDAAGAEFGFLSVPLSICVISLEIKAAVGCILKRSAE